MSRGDGTDFPSADALTGADAGQELGRWRLMASLAALLGEAQSDCADCARAAVKLVTDELGDGAVLVVLDPPGYDTALAVSSHVREQQRAVLDHLARTSDDARMRAFCGTFAASGLPVLSAEQVDFSEKAGRRFAQYSSALPPGMTVFAPIRQGLLVLGVLICTRDKSSGRYSDSDVSAIAAAADTISLLIEAAGARHAEQAALRRSQLAFATAPIGMAVLDAQGVIIEVNQAGCIIVGRADDMVGRSWAEFMDPTDFVPARRDLEAMLDGSESASVRTSRLRRGDGAIRWVRASTALLRDRDGAPDVFHCQFADITEQYEAQQDAARFAALIHSSPDFVAIANPHGELLFVNTAGRAMVGLPEEIQVEDLSVADILPPGEDARISAAIHDGTWSGRGALRDWRDESAIPVWSTSFVMPDPHSDGALAVAIVRRDIRANLAVEARAEQLAEQRRLLLAELVFAEQRERERIAGELHDDPVQLLAAGLLKLALAEQELDSGDPTAAARSLAELNSVLRAACASLRGTLADLEPPGLAGGTLRSDLAHGAEQLFAGTSTIATVTGEIEHAPQDVAIVFHRAGREALSNARRHASAERVSTTLTETPVAWQMTVDDDGCGIPTDLPHVAGHLGLRAMQSRVSALGGTCSIQRRTPSGTRVQITVPRPVQSSALAPLPQPQPDPRPSHP